MLPIQKKERGQALVIVAIALIALLVVAGLAIDGGTIFLERRRMQNAADAAALSGTRTLLENICNKNAAGADLAVRRATNATAENNGVKDTDGIAGNTVNGNVAADYVDKDVLALGPVGGGAVPTGATGVSVTVRMEGQTSLMMLLGINTLGASGHAVAMTGAPDTQVFPAGGGILPIGVPLEVVNVLESGEEFYVMENNQHNGGMFCRTSNNMCVGDPAAANAHRGWLNFNYIYNTEHVSQSDPLYRTLEANVPNRGCGKNPSASIDDGLQGWASGECPYLFPIYAGHVCEGNRVCPDGDFIHGDPGARQSSLQEIFDNYTGKVAYVPVFDKIVMSDYMSENFPKPEGKIGWPRAGGGGHAFLYHIVGYTAVVVSDKSSGHKLVGTFQSAKIGAGELVYTPSSGYNTGVCSEAKLFYTVSLWR